ncbi:MAG: hypothetical protein RIB98_04265 [Acidimicrobiales bacterium]
MPDLVKRLVRICKVGAIVAVGVGVVRAARRSGSPAVTGQATWQPLVDEPGATKRTGMVQFTEPATLTVASTPAPTWVEPVDGACPLSHPIKGNAGSGIFHVPGGMSYERTVPERCYATEADAEADGFRRAKR